MTRGPVAPARNGISRGESPVRIAGGTVASRGLRSAPSHRRVDPEARLQVTIRIMAMLGAAMLGVAQSDAALPLLTAFAAITSYLFTDRWRWFYLNRLLAYAAMIGAVFLSAGDFFDFHDNPRQLRAISSLLVYVQIVLMYQRKDARVYEQIAVFCALQVIVGALLSSSIWFGTLLMFYLAAALPSLASYAMYREQSHVGRLRTSVSPSSRRLPAMDLADGAPAWQRALGNRPLPYFALTAMRRPSSTREVASSRQLAGLILAALALAILFFYRMPRPMPLSNSPDSWGGATVGFNAKPTLDEMGTLLRSNRKVMRISFVEHDTEKPITIFGGLYLRGTALGQYDFQEGAGRWGDVTNRRDGRPIPLPPAGVPLVRQSIVLEHPENEVLFAATPAYQTRWTRGINIRSGIRQVYRRKTNQSRAQEFILATTAFRFGSQAAIEMHDVETDVSYPEPSKAEKQLLLEFDPERMPSVAAKAEELLADQGIDRTNRILVCRTLQNHFRDSQLYAYTLNLNMKRDRQVDPIDAFVGDHRRGHCQYFASALVMMLRSQNIPARMVIGYKPDPDEYNPLANTFTVRERDAHAWVEAYLEPSQVPESDHVAGRPGGGAWLRLDPTPGESAGRHMATSGGPITNRFGDAMDYAQYLWQDFVLGQSGTSSVEQASSDPEFADDFDSLMGPRRARTWERFWVAVREFFASSNNVLANLSMAAIGAVVLFVIGSMLRVRASWLARLVGRLWKPKSRESTAKPAGVEFYDRFEQIGRQVGLARAPSDTQQEFAGRLASRLAFALNPASNVVPEHDLSTGGNSPAQHDETAASPASDDHRRAQIEQIAALFYRVRFGGRPLSPTEGALVEATLVNLEQLAQSAVADGAKRFGESSRAV